MEESHYKTVVFHAKIGSLPFDEPKKIVWSSRTRYLRDHVFLEFGDFHRRRQEPYKSSNFFDQKAQSRPRAVRRWGEAKSLDYRP